MISEDSPWAFVKNLNSFMSDVDINLFHQPFSCFSDALHCIFCEDIYITDNIFVDDHNDKPQKLVSCVESLNQSVKDSAYYSFGQKIQRVTEFFYVEVFKDEWWNHFLSC